MIENEAQCEGPHIVETFGENPKDRLGAKKAPLHLIPKAGLIFASKVMELGANKYGPYNWRSNAVKEQVYIDAAMRHLMLAESGEDADPESGQPHYAHVIACMLILLDAGMVGNRIDDRAKAIEFSDLLNSVTVK